MGFPRLRYWDEQYHFLFLICQTQRWHASIDIRLQDKFSLAIKINVSHL